jgi:hypothetical protein
LTATLEEGEEIVQHDKHKHKPKRKKKKGEE